MSVDLGVGSHVAILAAAIARTAGPVLECGTGHWSTPLIHGLANGREVLSMETDPQWLGAFEGYRTPWHELMIFSQGAGHHQQIAAWASFGKRLHPSKYAEGVCFLDQSPGEARVPMAKEIANKFKFIVAHDVCADIPPSGGNYGWKQLDGFFKYHFIWKDVRPWTAVYSNVEEFKL